MNRGPDADGEKTFLGGDEEKIQDLRDQFANSEARLILGI